MLIARSSRGRGPGYFAPIESPTWVRADHAAAQMRPEDCVLGLVEEENAWAIPWWVIKNYHVANLVLGGRPVVVTLCEACASAAAFSPVLDGRRHRFQLEGYYNTTPFMSDVETRTYWDISTGEALHGPLVGTRLPRRALYQSRWQEWHTMHPGGWVVDGRSESRHGHGAMFANPDVRIVPPFVAATRLHVDDRLPDADLVLGVDLGPRGRAYPLVTLDHLGPVLHDTIDGTPVVILSRPSTWTAAAFSPDLDGRRLELRVTESGRIEDVETGSEWAITGRSVSGTLAGRSLRFVPSGVEKWYAWSAKHPGTDLHASAQ
ncbi:MAG TPA: DUF3179 domain-containing (seleno)protein [Methylomirabilota bacterium]|nr:DUF3179 domain-containing (seleno)protein [Methylomirabilota bacterium]